MELNKFTGFHCRECLQAEGHKEGCKAGALPDLVMAGDGLAEAIVLNGLPVEEVQLDWVCSFLNEESIFNGTDLLQAYKKLVAFYLAHRSIPPLATPASPASAQQPIEDQLARWAIDGAILKGRIGENPPPHAEHWLMEYWQIGRQLSKLGETSLWDNLTPVDAPASAPEASELITACRELIAYVDANPPMAEGLWCVQKIRAALAAKSSPAAWALLEECDPQVTTDPELADYWKRKGRDVIDLYAAPLPPVVARKDAPQPLKAEWQRLIGPGQVKVGDKLRFTIGDDKFSEVAKMILNAGTDQEEIIYNKWRNFYLVTSLCVANRGGSKNVEFLPDAARLAGKPDDKGD